MFLDRETQGIACDAEPGVDRDPGHTQAAPKRGPEHEEGNSIWHRLHCE